MVLAAQDVTRVLNEQAMPTEADELTEMLTVRVAEPLAGIAMLGASVKDMRHPEGADDTVWADCEAEAGFCIPIERVLTAPMMNEVEQVMLEPDTEQGLPFSEAETTWSAGSE